MSNLEEEILRRKKAARIQEIKRQKKNQRYMDMGIRFGIPAVIIVIVITVIVCLVLSRSKKQDEKADFTGPNISIEKSGAENEDTSDTPDTPAPHLVYSASDTAETTSLPGDVVSSYGILVDLADDTILAQRNARTRISPASMTKILTVLVAAENIDPEQLDDTVTITLEYTDYSYANDLSAVGFAENEVVTVRDLFYGTILPSGGDAALALACYVAGSEEEFVKLMNERLKELQLNDSTHFTNVAGMYDDDHYSTVYDMAMILHAAIDNDICRTVLNAHTYTTSSTQQHPDGIKISNWFLRRIEDKDCGLTVECAKTGFVMQSRNCAASFADDEDGHGYICVTADSSSGWRCIYDHVSIYSAFSGLTEKPPIPDDNELPDDETLDDADGNADDGSLTDLDDISGPDELNEPDEAGTESAPDRPSGGNSTQKNKIPVTNEITGN
ncbi:MAG: D-alanyl-D-alanine carboxypeptidase [Lachnospiraceae bacterium]|nr:D-alanyl-D-alanine carboxypeptidase [Lachnospiraceae bacterium]